MLAGRASLVEGNDVRGQALIKAIWTDDRQLSTRINREVAHYTGQAELAECIQEGLEARKHGELDTATFKLGRAVQLAAESGNDGLVVTADGTKYVSSVRYGSVSKIRAGKPAEVIATGIPSAASTCYDSKQNQLIIPLNPNNALAFIKLRK